MILKYKHHLYSEVVDEQLEVPDDIVFIYKDGDVGRCLYDGFNHYLGATKTRIEEFNNHGVSVCNDFEGISFIEFSNVIFECEIPIISYEEFYKKFELDTYYIFNRTKEDVRYYDEKGNINILEEIPSRLISIAKILSIKSQNLISIITAHVSPWSGEKRFLSINVSDGVSLYNLLNCNHWNVEVKRNCEQEFIDAINKTLELINYKVVSDQPSV